MAGKKGLVMGVANDRSIAWAIAKACHDHGAEMAFTFQGEALEKRVRPLAASIGAKIVLPCDVTKADSIDAVFGEIGKQWGQLDFLVHAIAFSDKNELRGRFLDTSSDNFNLTMNVSCYSLVAVWQRAVPLPLGRPYLGFLFSCSLMLAAALCSKWFCNAALGLKTMIV